MTQSPYPPGTRPEYASPAARLIAYIIDVVIIGFIVGIFYAVGFYLLMGGISDGSASGPGAAIGMLVMVIGFVIGFFWKPWFWSHGGQTPGYKVIGMQVVRAADGGPLSLGNAILRLIGYAVSAIVFYIGFIWIIFDAQRQGWQDKIASTVVIKTH